jgi:hypothetical protein
MDLTSYIKGLFPTFKKDDVIESCNLTIQGIREHTLPAYVSADSLFNGKPFKSKHMEDFVSAYNKQVERTSGAKLITSIKVTLENSLELLEGVLSASKKEFSSAEASIALTYKKSMYLRTVQCAQFAHIYARKFLNYVYILETAEMDDQTDLKGSLVPIEIKWIEDNFISFCEASRVLKTSKDKYDRFVKEIPEANISELTEMTLPETIGYSKLDPLAMRNLHVSWNPFYLVGMMVARFQADSYKSAGAELELLQLRKLNLERILAKEPDARIQKELEYMERRVSDLSYKLEQDKKDYAI